MSDYDLHVCPRCHEQFYDDGVPECPTCEPVECEACGHPVAEHGPDGCEHNVGAGRLRHCECALTPQEIEKG